MNENGLDNVLVLGTYEDKDIVVIRPKHIHQLLGDPTFSGVKEIDETELLNLLRQHMELQLRCPELEVNFDFKQVICYFLVRKDDKYLTARRSTESTDKRLHHKVLIGFGGHLWASHVKGPMVEWLQTEYGQEIKADRTEGIRWVGVVNHEGDDVSKVHVGLVFEVTVSGSVEVNPKEKDKFEEQSLLTLDELKPMRGEMELWSQVVLDHLLAKAMK